MRRSSDTASRGVLDDGPRTANDVEERVATIVSPHALTMTLRPAPIICSCRPTITLIGRYGPGPLGEVLVAELRGVEQSPVGRSSGMIGT